MNGEQNVTKHLHLSTSVYTKSQCSQLLNIEKKCTRYFGIMGYQTINKKYNVIGIVTNAEQ